MHGEDRPNVQPQLIIGALMFAEFPDHISIDYGSTGLNVADFCPLILVQHENIKNQLRERDDTR